MTQELAVVPFIHFWNRCNTGLQLSTFEQEARTMPKVKCPVTGCTYATDDVEAVLAAALINAHAMTHAGQTRSAASKASKVQRPTIAMAGTTEDWAYFELRWQDYKEATEITGRELVIQLLECC